jgi:hypothetical protein
MDLIIFFSLNNNIIRFILFIIYNNFNILEFIYLYLIKKRKKILFKAK